jgi:uncharacterized RDD family membrane protein YckC
MGAPAGLDEIARMSNLGLHLLLRWIGAWVDFLVMGLLLIGPDYFLGNKVYRETLAIWLGIIVLYFLIGEGIWGRTLGKLLTGMVVVDKSGRPPGLWKSGLRTILRLIEVNPLLVGGTPAAIVVALSRRRRRIGDMLAQTYVVRVKDLTTPRPALADTALLIKIGPTTLRLTPGMSIEPALLGAAGIGQSSIAKIAASPDAPGGLALLNVSNRVYRARLPGGRTIDVPGGQSLPLAPGVVIDFGGVDGVVLEELT